MTNYRLTPLQDTSEHKRRIVESTRKNMQMPVQKKHRNQQRMPAVIAAITLMLVIFLVGPYVKQALFNKQEFTIEKVVIPNVPYESLITSTYVEETNEFVYNTASGFYAFDVANKQQSLIVDTAEAGRIFDYGVSENWLVWAQPVDNIDKIHVLNRHTQELNVLETDYLYGIELQGDTIIYMTLRNQSDSGNAVNNYTTTNLKTGQSEILREFEEGSNSRPAIEGNHIAISERVDLDGQISTKVSIHNFATTQHLGDFIFPYESAENILLKGNKVFGLLWSDEDMQSSVIGELDIETDQFRALKIDVGVDDYATDGEHFAVAVRQGESNTVQLFELNEGKLKRTSTLSNIKERLVKPRFTEQGTLIVNGEGQDRAMYLIRFE
ncbi:hypothetical protein [Lysinibacillus sp. 54212]|uniref:hypothetical protein n=1 Tax=Lysinibacillus sp. 54212 TaxID=3119829 RepID=UPI002FCBF454